MQKRNTIKRIKLVIVAFITIAAFAVVRAQEQPRRALELVPVTAPLETRAGTDDGAAFAIRFIGSTHGSLEPCG